MKKIVAVNFTFALMGGLWLRDESGTVEWVSDTYGIKKYGQDTWDAWHKTAYHNGWCGMWYNLK